MKTLLQTLMLTATAILLCALQKVNAQSTAKGTDIYKVKSPRVAIGTSGSPNIYPRLEIKPAAKGLHHYDEYAWQLASDPWLLNGNASTDPYTNFIGTTDAHDLVFKVNNGKAARLEYNSATANTSFGYQALNINLTGKYNTAVGVYLLASKFFRLRKYSSRHGSYV